jgi:hypothetical protein
MLRGSARYGLSLLCLLLLSTSCRYLRSASFRHDGLRDNERPPDTLPVDGRDPSTPQGDVKHALGFSDSRALMRKAARVPNVVDDAYSCFCVEV